MDRNKILSCFISTMFSLLFSIHTGSCVEVITPTITITHNLTIEEYRIAKNVDELLKKAECFDLRCVPEGILTKREKWRSRSCGDLLDEINKQLKALGYRFAKKDQLNSDFYKGTKLLFSNLQDIRGFSFNVSKTRFIFIANHNKPERTEVGILFLDGKITDIPLYHGHGPLFWGEKILKLSQVENSSRQKKFEYDSQDVDKETVNIYSGDKVIYKFEFVDYPFDYAIQRFYVQNGHWVLEFMKAETEGKKVRDYHGTVVVDGVNLNERYGGEEIFNYIYIKGKPFYFFKDKSGYTRIKNSNITLPLKYEEVKHYDCCSYSAFNPRWNDDMIWFYGIKDGYLHYVEAGVYE
ncbi:MAG: hypothetical protein ABSB22_14320 [Thermodesulfobacteriota bacterium]|jgi:hypothetical protein